MRDLQEFISILETVQSFKTKGTGPIRFHLGMEFFHDDDNTLCISLPKYIEKLVKTYEQMFGKPPKQVVILPLRKRRHP
jgi:hypothetical protein